MIQHTAFRKIISIFVVITQVGCTNLQPIEQSPETLQERIRHGDIIKVGDSVSILTEDEKEHRFVVTGIDADKIHGEGAPPASYDHRRGSVSEQRTLVTIPIDSIVGVQTREFSVGKTAVLSGGIVGILVLIGMAVGGAAVLAASSP